MQPFVRGLLHWSLRLLLRPVFSGWMPMTVQRAWLRVMSAGNLPPRGTLARPVDMHGLRAERVSVPQTGTRVLLYLHGGGYCIGAASTHRALAAHIARASHAVCYLPEYRLAPEHPHPAALDDALTAYRWLLQQDHAPDQIIIAGDSAGGGLALATVLAARDAGLALPAGLVLLSPWADLSLSGATFATHARRDPLLSHSILDLWSRCYLGGQAATNPLCSPLFARLQGLPPMLVQVGSEEILLADALRLEQAARAAEVTVTLQVYEHMWHDFQLHAGVLHESDRAISAIGHFVKNTIAAR